MRLDIFAKFFIIMFLILSISITHSKSSQASSAWSMTLYDTSSKSLVQLSESTVFQLSIPQSYIENSSLTNPTTDIYHRVLSGDAQYLMTFAYLTEPYVGQAYITNLFTGETLLVEHPPLQDTEFFVSYRFGVFSPDMRNVTLSYYSHVPTSGCCNSGGIVVIELETGLITHLLDIDEVYTREGNTAWIDNWTNEGIWFAPRCSNCTPEYRYQYRIWNFDTDTISDTGIIHDRRYFERLSSTGELLYSDNHEDFPMGGDSYPQYRNVISWYQENETPLVADGQVVYYNEANPASNPHPHWIMNGRAFLVNEDDLHNVVVFRDGHTLTFDYEFQQNFVAMTDDGWITIDRENNNRILQFIVSDTTVSNHILYETSSELEVVNIKPSTAIEDLPEISMEISSPDVRFCPGTLPTQFHPGDWAEVIANHEEVAIARMVVGDTNFEDMSYEKMEILPLGARIQILDEFACVPGWGYLKVAYEGRIGWILEIYLTAYHIAPISE